MIVFLINVLLLLLVSFLCPFGVYLIGWLSWVKYGNNCLEVFQNQSILQNQFPLILKFHWNKCLAVYGFFLCFFIGVLIGWYILFDYLIYLYSINIIYVFIVIIGGVLLYLIISFLLIKKSWKEMSGLGVYDRKTALTLFANYQDEFVNSLGLMVKNFELFNNQHFNSMINTPFQFNQRRYKRKVQRLKKKLSGTDEEKYQYQLLKLYINYLKTYAVFFKRITNLNEVADQVSTAYVVIDGQRHENFEVLKEVLISNFFAFAN